MTKQIKWTATPILNLVLFLVMAIPLLASNGGTQSNEFSAYDQILTLYKKGDYERAKTILGDIPVDSLLEDELVANLTHMKGRLEGLSDPNAAIPHLVSAETMYTDQERDRNARIVQFELVGMYILSDRFEEASETLNQEGLESTSPGMFYNLKARLALKQAAYADALRFGQLSFDAFDDAGDQKRAGQALNNLGLYKMMAGDFAGGLKDTLEGQGGVADSGDPDQYYYSLVNMLVYQRCANNSDAEALRFSLNKRLGEQPDLDLQNLFDWAQTCACP